MLAETWLIMEYCDGGNLQDAVDRGVFWARPRGPGRAAGAGGGRGAAHRGAPLPCSGGGRRPPAAAPNGGTFTPDGLLHGGWPTLPPGAGVDPVSPRGAGGSSGSGGSSTTPTLTPDMAAITATAADIAAAMAYLHSLDVLHGDLTGGNVLLCSTGAADGGPVSARARSGDPASPSSTSAPAPRAFTAKVADFGLARVLAADAVSTGTYGTVTHMPPELLTAGRLSKAADVYAFGVLLWEMYTGRRPWAGLMQMQVIFAVTVRRARLTFPTPRPHPRYAALADECMAPAPEDRPSFEEVLDRLREVEGAEGG